METDLAPSRSVSRPIPAKIRRRVLLVEDQPDLAHAIAILLKGSGFDVHMLHEGTEVHSVARDFEPHFILLDIGLPGLDGYQVAEQIRGNPGLDRAVIVAISAYPPDSQSRELNFSHRFVKPLDFATLLALLSS